MRCQRSLAPSPLGVKALGMKMRTESKTLMATGARALLQSPRVNPTYKVSSCETSGVCKMPDADVSRMVAANEGPSNNTYWPCCGLPTVMVVAVFLGIY